MYPGTIVNIIDQSAISQNTVTASDSAPLFLAISSFDRGPEDLRVVYGNDFYKLYGTKMNFAKHGQPALQCKSIIDAGGKLLVKRITASDSALANVVFIANVTETTTLTVSTEATAHSVEYWTTGTDNTSATTKYVAGTGKTVVKWETASYTSLTKASEVLAKAKAEYTAAAVKAGTAAEDGSIVITSTGRFPLIVVADNGKGVSSKSVKVTPDYSTSKDMSYMYYNIYVYDGTTQLENVLATLDPSVVYNNTLYGINEDTSTQVKFEVVPGVYEAYLEMLAKTTGIVDTTLSQYDLIGLTNTRKGSITNDLTLDAEGVDIQATYGVELANGSNGTFGDAPFSDPISDAYKMWSKAACFTLGYGEGFADSDYYDPAIFDLDQYKIAAVFDANYPSDVKKAIATFVNFREDCMYFRDYGLDVGSYAAIYNTYTGRDEEFKTCFCSDYCTTYQIYDPETKIRETVTMMYDFAADAVNHFATGAYRPMAGIANSMILGSAIEGTVNFVPRITPSINQKSLLDDMRVNYAIFQEGQCVVQSLFTSQTAYTQLSYLNNVLAIQEVIRSVRKACPKQRYTFVSGSDFTLYADAVNTILKGFKDHFSYLNFSYQQNSIKAAQKIFYAVIQFRFNNWAQTEVFDVYALGDES